MGQENKWTTGYVFLERIFLRHVLQFLGGIFTILQKKIILQYYILYYCIINGFILVFTFIIFYIEADKKYVCVCIYIYKNLDI